MQNEPNSDADESPETHSGRERGQEGYPIFKHLAREPKSVFASASFAVIEAMKGAAGERSGGFCAGPSEGEQVVGRNFFGSEGQGFAK